MYRFCSISALDQLNLKTEQLLGDPIWSRARRLAHTASLLALGLAYREHSLACGPTPPLNCTRALSEANLTWVFKHREQLKENNYHHLQVDPDLLCSRSHTKNLAVAGLCLSSFGPLSYGVDLESANRVMNPGVEKFYLGPDEVFSAPSQLLQAWSLKEAAFKALSSWLLKEKIDPKNPLTLKSLQLFPRTGNQFVFKTHLFSGLEGLTEFQELMIDGRPYILAQARLMKASTL